MLQYPELMTAPQMSPRSSLSCCNLSRLAPVAPMLQSQCKETKVTAPFAKRTLQPAQPQPCPERWASVEIATDRAIGQQAKWLLARMIAPPAGSTCLILAAVHMSLQPSLLALFAAILKRARSSLASTARVSGRPSSCSKLPVSRNLSNWGPTH